MSLSSYIPNSSAFYQTKNLKQFQLDKKNFYSTRRYSKSNWVHPVGRGRAKPTCNHFYKYQCDCGRNIKIKHHSCGSLTCPTCYNEAIKKNALRVAKRFKKINKACKKEGIKIKLYHYSFNVNWVINDNLSYRKARKKFNKICKEQDLNGCVIFHPWRFHPKTKRPYLSPHFHFIGVGNPIKSSEFFEKYGFTYKRMINPHDKSTYRIKKKKEIYSLVRYLLSHCGIVSNTHVIRWIGAFSYNQVSKINKETIKEVLECDQCHTTLRLCENPLVYKSGSLFYDRKKPYDKYIYFYDDPNDLPMSYDRYQEIRFDLQLPYELARVKKKYDLELKNIERVKRSLEVDYYVK